MESFKDHIHKEELNEVTLMAVTAERKLASAVKKIEASNSVHHKVDLLAKAIHYSISAIALELTKSNKRKRRH